jgi:hypothetical protein
MPRREILGKRRGERDGFLEVGISAQSEILLCHRGIAVQTVQVCQLVVDLPQPPCMRGLISMLDTPAQIRERGLSLVKAAGQLGGDDPRHPPHDEDLSPRQPFRLFEDGDGVPDPAASLQERHVGRVSRPQQSDRAEIEGLLAVRQAGFECLHERREKLDAVAVQMCIGVLAHQQEEQLRIARRPRAIDSLQVLELGAMPGGRSRPPVASSRQRYQQGADQEQSE